MDQGQIDFDKLFLYLLTKYINTIIKAYIVHFFSEKIFEISLAMFLQQKQISTSLDSASSKSLKDTGIKFH